MKETKTLPLSEIMTSIEICKETAIKHSKEVENSDLSSFLNLPLVLQLGKFTSGGFFDMKSL